MVAMALDGSTWQTPRADMTWTAVTSYVSHADGISIKRGRAGERDDVQAGTCSFTLLDRTRQFDPENGSSPYDGFLNPGVPVWISVKLGGAEWDDNPLLWDGDPTFWDDEDFDRFFGFVEDWPQGSYDPADKCVHIAIEATDAFGMLALGRQKSVMENAVMALNPVGYWPLTEGSDTPIVVDKVGVNFGATVDDPTFGQDPLAPGLGTSVEFDGVSSRIDISSGPLIDVTTQSWTVSGVIETTEPADPSSIHPIFLQLDGNNAANSVQVFVDEDGLVARAGFSAGVGTGRLNETVVTDGRPHLFLAQRSPTAFDFGVAIDSATLDTTSFVPATQGGNGVAIGGTPLATAGYDDNYFAGSLSQIALFSEPLDSTERQSIVDAYEGLVDQTTDERVDYLLTAAGVPTADRDMTVGFTPLGAANHDGQFTLDLIRRIEKTEQGRFFIAKNGDATFHARYHGQLVASTSSATFADNGTDPAYQQVEVNRARRYVYNKVNVTADGLAPVIVQDDDSIAAHGERELTIDAPLLPSATAQQSLGEYVLTNSKDPQPRVFGMSVPLHKDFDTLLPIVLPLEQGDRVTFERTPVGTGSTISWEQTLEGYEERFDTVTWTWTPYLSPAEPVTYGVWGTMTWGGTFIWGY